MRRCPIVNRVFSSYFYAVLRSRTTVILVVVKAASQPAYGSKVRRCALQSGTRDSRRWWLRRRHRLSKLLIRTTVGLSVPMDRTAHQIDLGHWPTNQGEILQYLTLHSTLVATIAEGFALASCTQPSKVDQADCQALFITKD